MKEIFSDASFTPAALIASSTVNGTQNTGFLPLPANTYQTLWIRDTYTVTNGGVLNEFENGFRQNSVPGPLPLLGASAALSFSRKLRRRINGARQLNKG